jgi:hypothetical protein
VTRPAPALTRVLYVGGVPRSGSTLTDLMLGQLPGHVGLGELFYLWHNGPGRDVQCACGEPFSRCPLWTEVGRIAFGGWPRDIVDEVLRLQRVVDRTSRIPLLLVPRLRPAFHAHLTRYREILATLYAAVARASGAQVVVDSSKRPSLAFVLRGAPGVDLRVAHVVRDPRGVAFSWSKRVALPAGASHRTEMPRWSAVTVSRRWVTVNAAFGLLSLLGVPRLAVRYEDLVAAPRVHLARIAALHDLPLTDDDLDFVTGDGLRVGSSHLIAGSRIRLAGNTMVLRVDDEWRRALPARRRRLVSGATWPLRWKYGYR